MDQREDGLGYYEPNLSPAARYRDRRAAGAELAQALSAWRGKNVLVLGIPRGGVPVAYEVARLLDADLDVIVVRKIGAPGHEELGIGAIAGDGTLYVNERLCELIGVSDAVLQRLTAAQAAEAQRREARFRAGLSPLHPAGRTVIVVDDGLATGATMRAAVRSLARRGAQRVIVAIPVGAPDTCDSLAAEAERVVCPFQPDPFYAVGQHYDEFPQTSDAEVEALLRRHHEQRNAQPAAEVDRGPQS